MSKRMMSKAVGAVALAAGVAVLVIDIRRSVLTGTYEVWLWGPIGLLAAIFGAYELFFAKDHGEEGPPES